MVARLRPISKAESSVMEMRPFSMSAMRFLMPWVMLSPRVSMAVWMNSGLVAAKLDGAIASTYWRVRNCMRSLVRPSAMGSASASLVR